MQFTMPPNQQYNNKEYLSTVLETMKQKMLASSAAASSAAATGTRGVAATGTTMSPGTTASELVSMPLGEIITGVGYILLILVFVTKVFFKTLNRITTYRSSYSFRHSVSQNRGDGPYNRFGFMINADSDSEFSSSDNDDDAKNMLSPHLQQLPQQTPQSPPPPLRRSKRLQMKSEMNLTRLQKLEKQTQTDCNIYYSSASASSASASALSLSSKILFPSVSSDPLPKRSLSFVSPSPHPEHDEELAFEINRRYEKRMQKRSECNSPPIIRRLIL